MRAIFIYIFLFIIANSALGESHKLRPKFFLARLNETDSTFYIILDGNFYFQNFNPRVDNREYSTKFGQPIDNPTRIFESEFMKKHANDPAKYQLIRSDTERFHERRYSGEYIYEINDVGFISSIIGLWPGDQVLIAKPSRDGVSWREVLQIKSYFYFASSNPITDVAYLVAKTNKINEFQKIEDNSEIFAATYFDTRNDIKPVSKIDTLIPQQVEIHYDSSTTFKSQQWQQIKEQMKSEKLFRKISGQYDVRASVQPVSIATKNELEKRYLIVTSLCMKGCYADIKYVNSKGKTYHKPFLYTNGVLYDCLGIVRLRNEFGIESLLVCKVSLGDYNGGVSLFKHDSDGIFREILFFQTMYD